MNKKNWLIALGVAAVYLAVSFATRGWAWSWLIWVGYAAYRLLEGNRAA